MGKGKLKNVKNGGKMYDDDPGCKYLVIECPWPYCPVISRRDDRWRNHVGAWLYYATNKTFQPDELFYLGTRNEVVARFSNKVDVSCLLGEHNWRKVTKESVDRSSWIFEYDYGMKGHPDDHQWMSHAFKDFSKDVHLQNNMLPITQPYPPPTWADCRRKMSSCKDLALPMPKDKPKSDKEVAVVSNESVSPATTTTQQPQPSSIFSGLADHIPERPRPEPTPPNGPPGPRPGQLYTGKLDPDDEDAAAARLLKSEPRDEKVPLVKLEAGLVQSESTYDPSPAVQAQYEAWRRARDTQSAGMKQEPSHAGVPVVKAEPANVKSELVADEPSKELMKLHAEYERRRSATRHSEVPGSVENTSPQHVKPEQGAEPRLNPHIDGPRIKPGQSEIRIKAEPTIIERATDPRRRGSSGASVTRDPRTAIKREADSTNSEGMLRRILLCAVLSRPFSESKKRIKTE
ncbi:hypothetical protein BC629DRAFT_274335 [Irpex lacteus]|nr:hypothetical protein BC629DRAFT_274335 [Irpex lacteus]